MSINIHLRPTSASVTGAFSYLFLMNRNDILWKGILEDLFADFLIFFIPDAPQQIDFDRGFEFLDKELEQVFPPDEDIFKPRHIDKLVKVFTRQGDEHWVLIHIEVQGQADKTFAQRMFTYYSRLFDRYLRPITAFAILSDKTRSFHPVAFEQEFLGTRLSYRFNTYKILDQSVADLEASENPFAVVVLTVLAALKKKQVDETELLVLKLELARRLLAKPFSKFTIRALMNFLRHYVRFQKPEMSVIFEEEYDKLTNRQDTMGIEQLLLTLAKQEGQQEGRQEGRQEGIEQGRLEKDTLVVRNLLASTSFSDTDIARLVGVEVAFVAQLRTEMTK